MTNYETREGLVAHLRRCYAETDTAIETMRAFLGYGHMYEQALAQQAKIWRICETNGISPEEVMYRD